MRPENHGRQVEDDAHRSHGTPPGVGQETGTPITSIHSLPTDPTQA